VIFYTKYGTVSDAQLLLEIRKLSDCIMAELCDAKGASGDMKESIFHDHESNFPVPK
jgi:hypothetical protein